VTVRVDFLKTQSQPALGWVLLALGVGLMGAALAFESHRTEAAAASQAQALQRHEAWQKARAEASRPKVLTPQERRSLRVRPMLNRPLLRSLSSIEEVAQAPVYLLRLSIDPASGKVQIEAEAPSFEHALAFVEMIGGDGALRQAQLLSHDVTADPSGVQTVRFSAVSRWQTP
jgi:hypothetical protein